MDRRRSSTAPNRHATDPPVAGHVAPSSPSDNAGTRSVLPILQNNQLARRPSKSSQSISSSPKIRSSTMALMLTLHPEQSPPSPTSPSLPPQSSSSSSSPSSASGSGGGIMNRFKKMRGSVSSQGTKASEQYPVLDIGNRTEEVGDSYSGFDGYTISSGRTRSSGTTATTSSAPLGSVASFISEYTLDSALQSNSSVSHGSHGEVRSRRAGEDWLSTTSKGAGGSSESLPFSLAETEAGKGYAESDPRASSVFMDPWDRDR